jgi:hypothetical protein
MSHLTAKESQYKSAFDVKSLSDLAIWYDFSDVSSLDLSGSILRKVNDKSGNNRNGHASNLTTGYLYYDRMVTGAWMNNTGFQAFDLSDVSFSTFPVAGSVFFVLTPYETRQSTMFQGTTGLAGGKYMISRASGCNIVTYEVGGNAAAIMTSFSQMVRRTHIVSAITDQSVLGNLLLSNTQSLLYVNGFLNAGVFTSSNVWNQGLTNISVRFGNNVGDNGGRNIFHEILMFSNAVNYTTRCAVEEYLRKKWYDTVPEKNTYTSPLDLSGCVLWLDACDQSTLTYSGSSVIRWGDKSGNAYDASGIGTSNPIWDASRGGVRFLSNSRMFTTSPGPSSGAETGFIVLDISANAIGGRARIIQTSDLTLGREISVGSSAVFQFTGNNTTDSRTQAHAFNTKYAISWRLDASANGRRDVRFAVDGIVEERELNATKYPTTGVGVTTFGNLFETFQGVMYEAALFSNELTDSEIMKMHNYLMTKWNITKYTNPITNSINLSISQDWPFCNQPVFQRPSYTPYDIKNLGAWYDAADTGSFDLSGTSIRIWRDKSGWQNDLSACVGGELAYKALPTYLSDTQEVDICGGFFRLRNRNISLNGNLCNRPHPGSFSLFMVFKPNQIAGTDVSGSAHSLFNMRSGTANRFIHMPNIVGPAPNFSNQFLTYTPPVAGLPSSINIGSLSTNDYNILGASCGFGRYVVTNNGTTTADITGSVGLGVVQLDANTVTNVGRTTTAAEYFGGKVKEIIFYNRAVSSSERETIEYYLAEKWNLTSLLPSNHPSFSRIGTLVADGFSPRGAPNCRFWLDAMSFYNSNYSNGQSISSWSDKSLFSSTVDISGTVTYSTSYGVPGVNLCNGVVIGRLTPGASLSTYQGTTFVVASVDSLSPGTPQYGVTLATGDSLTVVTRNMFLRSDTSLSVANILGGTGAVLCNLSCNATTAGTPFIWETAFANAALLFALCNGTFPAKSSGHNSTGGFTNTRVFLGCDASAANIPSWKGNIHEVLLYPSVLGDWERYNIRGYLAQKWKISNSVPFGTPYGLVAP